MTDRSKRSVDRLTTWAYSPRGGAALAALAAMAVLLPLWLLAVNWYRTELLSAESTQQALRVFEIGGLIGMALFAGLVYLSVNRQALLSQAVHERTRAVTRINQQLEEDLARRQQMEEELRRSDERYRALARSFPNGAVFLFDANLRYTLADGAGLADVGLTKEMLEGLTIWETLPPDSIEIVEPHYRAALAGEAHVFEAEFGGRLYLSRTLPLRDDRGHIIAGMAVTQDITDRKRAEQSLHRWAHIFEHAEWGVAIGSADGRSLEMMNPAYAKMHGFTVEELSGMPIGSVFAPGTADELSALIRAANETGHAVMESKHVRKDGTIFPVLVDLTAVKDERGQLLYRVANVQDITDRKRAEDELRDNEARLRVLIEQMPALLWTMDAELRFTSSSGAGLASLGLRPQDVIGRSLLDFAAPNDAEFAKILDMHRRVLRGESVSYESLRRGRNIQNYLEPLRAANGDIVGCIGVGLDLTERKRVEEALRERELQYRSVFESSLDGLFINNLDGELVDFNPAAAHMHGYTVDEFRQIQPPQFVHPDSLPLFTAFMETIKAGREYRCRAVDVSKDGSTFHVEVSGTPFMLRSQPHAFAIVRDISAQVEAERLLEKRVEERTRELSTLLDVSRNIASTLEIEPLLGLILDALKVFVDYTSARINTLEGQVLRVRAVRGLPRVDRKVGTEFSLSSLVAEEVLIQRRVLVIPDINSPHDPWAITFRTEGSANIESILVHARSWMGVPLVARGRVIGNLSLEHEQPGFYNAHHAEVVSALADQVAVALENARLFTEAQGKAVLEERQRLARDLHDSVTQSLYSLTLLAEAGRRLIEVDTPQAARYVNDMGEIAQQSLKEMRLLVYQLRPLALEHEGLIGAVQARLDSVEKRAGIEARFLIEGNLRNLPPMVEEGLFRIAQEALNNALKHAAARSVVVRLRGEDECVTLEVADDGRGSELLTTDVKGGLGLTSIKERVAQLQGALTIDSAPGAGTRISVEVPRSFPAATPGR